jgi:hypothetical protein
MRLRRSLSQVTTRPMTGTVTVVLELRGGRSVAKLVDKLSEIDGVSAVNAGDAGLKYPTDRAATRSTAAIPAFWGSTSAGCAVCEAYGWQCPLNVCAVTRRRFPVGVSPIRHARPNATAPRLYRNQSS